MKHGTNTVEAFLELTGEEFGATGPSSYRAGYRCLETGEIICVIEIPASIAEPAIFAQSDLATMTTPDGRIVTTITSVEDRDLNERQRIIAEPIDAFIARSLSSENLRMEEATVADLEILLKRLNHSADLVSKTIGEMANNFKGSS
ncbi:hypothetical protein [Bradyrhizobium sp. LMTR 3]|uniref:hypothetical protein n=1 Tax=Bradyrhizobium sp. LMTR 3 TaxID=189873 RepID=UPI000810BB3E|nr:hypothetical protein [Bradyrhizobium sp. LMTR 3]OCK59856.1 hypothetical protein LMTR3_19750 [Bradyrhizobium sp. LMTR 3]